MIQDTSFIPSVAGMTPFVSKKATREGLPPVRTTKAETWLARAATATRIKESFMVAAVWIDRYEIALKQTGGFSFYAASGGSPPYSQGLASTRVNNYPGVMTGMDPKMITSART
jgi:hypothetical protein